jgi:uncharacterized protein YcaQ
MLDDGEIVAVEVEGWPGQAFSTPAALERPLNIPTFPPTLLAPFDNLLWERNRVERIFGFRYRVEIYVPEPKRLFGYVLPPLVRGGDRPEGPRRRRHACAVARRGGARQSALETLARHLARQIDFGRAAGHQQLTSGRAARFRRRIEQQLSGPTRPASSKPRRPRAQR